MIGEAAALGSAGLWAVSTIVVKSVTGRLSASYIMAVRTGIAAALALAALPIFVPARDALDLPTSTALLLLATAPLAIAGDLCFVRALALGDVSRVFTLSTSLYILFSVLGGVALAGNEVSWLLPLSGLAILVGTRLVINETPAAATSLGEGAEAAVLTLQRARTAVLWLSVVASVLWSSGLLVLGEALKETNPVVATTIRLPVMALAMIVVAGVRGDYARFGFTLENLRVLTLSGCLALFSMFCFLLAADQGDAGKVAVLTSTTPIFVAPLAWLVLKEQITRRVLAGTGVCMIGIWLAVA